MAPATARSTAAADSRPKRFCRRGEKSPAAVILGAKSSSLELLKSLTERLPVTICRARLDTPTQPIAIDDVLDYLDVARSLPPARIAFSKSAGPILRATAT